MGYVLLTGSEILLYLAVFTVGSQTNQKKLAWTSYMSLTGSEILLNVAVFSVDSPTNQKKVSS